MHSSIIRQKILLLASIFLWIQGSKTTLGFSLVPAFGPRTIKELQLEVENGFPLFAKKKKGNKNKKKKKGQSGFEWATSFSLKPFESQAGREMASVACASYEGRTGKPLSPELNGAQDIPKVLWTVPVACVVVTAESLEDNNEETDADDNEVSQAKISAPIIKFANVAALETVGLKEDQFEQFVATTDPKTGNSKLAENMITIDLPCDMKGDKNYESGYRKKIIRGEKQDQDITILDANRWLMEKSTIIDGKFVTETVGVAYAWSEWLEGDRTTCKPGGERETQYSKEELEESVQSQASHIRHLKEDKGLGNKDPEVADAVGELLRLKALLEKVAG